MQSEEEKKNAYKSRQMAIDSRVFRILCVCVLAFRMGVEFRMIIHFAKCINVQKYIYMYVKNEFDRRLKQ